MTTTPWATRSARGVRVTVPNFPFCGHASYREFGEAYNPAVGFAPRKTGSVVSSPPSALPGVTNSISWLRSLNTELYFEYLMDMDFPG